MSELDRLTAYANANGDVAALRLAADDTEKLRARVAELEAMLKVSVAAGYAVSYWAIKAEAVRVAAWGHITTWPDDDPDPVATARLRTALSSCPPLGSVNACRHGEGR